MRESFSMPDAIRSPRGDYLLKGGAVISVDKNIGTLPKADVLVRDGVIEAIGRNLSAPDAEILDAADMIVMPGLIDTHYHMWSTLGRNFVTDGLEYFPAKYATSAFYGPDDFYNSVRLALADLVNCGVTTVHNWAHNNRSPEHVDAELRAHGESGVRARYSLGHIDRYPRDQVNTFEDLPRVRGEWFDGPERLDGLVQLGINLRGPVQTKVEIFYEEMEFLLKTGLPVAVHATQAAPNVNDAADYERRGFLGPNFLFAHYIAAEDSDREALARTSTPLSFATISTLRLGSTGGYQRALMKMREAGVLVSLSSDAASLSPPDMLQTMRITWGMGIPWIGTDTEHLPPIGVHEIIEMATLNGAVALGLGDVTGSLSIGKRADIIMVRVNDINIAPLANIETTLVMNGTPANVDTVMVDGRLLKRNGKLLHVSTQDIVTKARYSALRIRKASGGMLTPRCPDCEGNAVFEANPC
jgi:cytosine/adenosine deaminase-related metal-dependent hydrolase